MAFDGPPVEKAVTGERAGVVAQAEVDVTAVALEIVEAVRNDVAVGERGEIVVKNAYCLCGEQLAVPIKPAQQFAFFRVDAEDGVERIQIDLFLEGDGLELLVAVSCGPHGHGFEGLAASEFPQRLGPHRIAGGVIFENLAKVGL